MKWTQLAVIIFVAIQQSSCKIREDQMPIPSIEDVNGADASIEIYVNKGIKQESVSHPPLRLQRDYRHFSSLYNVEKHPRHQKMVKVIKMNDQSDDVQIKLIENDNQQEKAEAEARLIDRQDVSDQDLTKRSKMKGALLFAGGAAVGALAMKHFSKPSGGGNAPADPNAGIARK